MMADNGPVITATVASKPDRKAVRDEILLSKATGEIAEAFVLLNLSLVRHINWYKYLYLYLVINENRLLSCESELILIVYL